MKFFDRFKKPAQRPWNKWDYIALGVSGAVFSLLSLFNMSRWSVWFDEAYGLFLIRSDYLEVAKLTSTDVHPPMYYWALKLWTSMFGTGSEIAVRSLSLVFMLTAIGFIYLLIRRWFGQKAAIYSLALLALTPLLLRYSVEARMYGMTTAIVAASTYVMVLAMEKPKAWKWITYGLLVSLGLWTHYFTAVAFAAQWVWRFVAVRKSSLKQTLKAFFAKDWLLAYAVAFVAYLPWLYFAVKQLVNIQGGGFWISPIGPSAPFNFAADTLMYRVGPEINGWMVVLLWAIMILLIVLVVRLWPRLKAEQKTRYSLLLIMALVPLGLMILASLPPLRPALVNRYIMASALFLVAFIGLTIALTIGTRKHWNRLSTATLGLVLVAMVSGILYVYQIGNFNKDANDPLPIRPTLEMVWQRTKPGEPTLVASVTRYYEVAYYERRAPAGTTVYFEEADHLTWGSYDPLRDRNAPHKVYDTVQFARDHGGTIWYVGDWTEPGKPSLPKAGTWKVLDEVHAPGLPDGKSDIRAVELQLVD